MNPEIKEHFEAINQKSGLQKTLDGIAKAQHSKNAQVAQLSSSVRGFLKREVNREVRTVHKGSQSNSPA